MIPSITLDDLDGFVSRSAVNDDIFVQTAILTGDACDSAGQAVCHVQIDRNNRHSRPNVRVEHGYLLSLGTILLRTTRNPRPLLPNGMLFSLAVAQSAAASRYRQAAARNDSSAATMIDARSSSRHLEQPSLERMESLRRRPAVLSEFQTIVTPACANWTRSPETPPDRTTARQQPNELELTRQSDLPHGSRLLETLSGLEIDLQGKTDVASRIAHVTINRILVNLIAPRFRGTIRRRIHGAEMLLPLSHALPRYVGAHPMYDSVLPSFSKFLASRKSSGKLTIVDVGANIGDTVRLVAAALEPLSAKFICVEADDAYLALLRRNTEALDVKSITRLPAHRPALRPPR